MRILIISDLHANLTALEAVIAEAGKIDAVWCLGDLVGYGPDPNECIELVRQLPNLICILGNHDAAALNLIDPGTFNHEARQAITWTQETLTPSSRAFLEKLPEKVHVLEAEVTLCHGSPRHPVWEYLLDTRTATINFAHFETIYCFVGHTHLPVIYNLKDTWPNSDLTIPDPNHKIILAPRSIVNPGSVGQPRDRDARAAFAIFDPETLIWDYRRISYDIAATQTRMISLQLPNRHIQRLAGGW
jgi:predicted phosphodiesterase